MKSKSVEKTATNQATELQRYGTVVNRAISLDHKVRLGSADKLNQILADTITLRDMYKKHHWQVAGPTFYQLHLLFDKHFDEQVEMVDAIGERIQLLGGVTIAMGGEGWGTTKIQRPPRGREEVPVQISRLLEAHKLISQSCLDIAEKASDAGDQGTKELGVSNILRPHRLQSWFIGQHLVEMPL